MRTLKDMSVKKGEKVLVRVDFNVPLTEEGEVADDERIRMALPTISWLMKMGARITLVSHLGRPEGRDERYSLRGVAKRLAELLGVKVSLFDLTHSNIVIDSYEKEGNGNIILLENIRFSEKEEKCDLELVEELTKFGDLFVQEAFSCCHRGHASIVGIPEVLPSFAGDLLEREVSALWELLTSPEKPFVVVMGGKKVETKAGTINKLSETADEILVNGLLAKEIKEKEKEGGLSLDHPEKIVYPENINDSKDLDSRTIEKFKEKIENARTVFWNGPMGKFEEEKYSRGTREIAESVAKAGYSVAGGGETLEAAKKFGVMNEIGHISTGGGATLEFLEKEGKLPGILALEEAEEKVVNYRG